MAAYILQLVRVLGPLYTKIAQLLAVQSGLLSEAFREELRESFDRNPSAAFAEVRRSLEQAYGRKLSDVFATFDPIPIGSGSVAQVHRASLPTGQIVAVKLLKPQAARSLEAALAGAGVLIQLAEAFFPQVRPFRLVENFRDLQTALRNQTDLDLESRNQRAARRSFSSNPYVVVPEVYDELCHPQVLVMEFVEGAKGYDVAALPGSPAQTASRMQDAFYSMVYLHGRFHVDPHPGNVLFCPDGRLALLDFGLVGNLDEQTKWDLSGFYYACVREEWDRAIDSFATLFLRDGDQLVQNEVFRRALEPVLISHFKVRTERWSTVGFIADAAAILRVHGHTIRPGMSLLVLALLTGEGFLQDVDPTIDIWANARRFVDRASPYVSAAVKARFDSTFNNPATSVESWRRRADRVLVAPTHLDRFVLPSEYPLIVSKAKGPFLIDADDRRYIDLSCGYGPHILGFGSTIAVEAAMSAMNGRGVNALATRDEIELAELIVDALPAADGVVFANSGSEAVGMAMRLCRAYTGRQKVAKFEGHFHGQTDQGLVSAWFRFAGDENSPEPIAGSLGALEATVEQTLVLSFGSDKALEQLRAARHEIACVICEPMPSATCSIDAAFLSRLRLACWELDIPLVFDEIVSGFRVAFGGVQTLANLAPDLTCLGKIIGGGLPCGAVAGRRDLIEMAKSTRDPFLDVQRRTFVGGTFSGNATTCAAGAAVLGHLAANQDLYLQLRDNTETLRRGLLHEAMQRDVALKVSAQTGILTLGFGGVEGASIRERLTGGNFKANLALSYYMRERSVYLPELHTLMIGMSHTPEIIGEVTEAFGSSLEAMLADGALVQ